MVHSFTPQIFDSLPIWTTANQKIKTVQKHLPTLGKIICNYGLQDHFGLALLHKHFKLHDEERLVEWFDKNHSEIQPCKVKESTKTTPYLWKTDNISWYPLEFCFKGQLSDTLVNLSHNLTYMMVCSAN